MQLAQNDTNRAKSVTLLQHLKKSCFLKNSFTLLYTADNICITKEVTMNYVKLSTEKLEQILDQLYDNGIGRLSISCEIDAILNDRAGKLTHIKLKEEIPVRRIRTS